MSPDTCTATQLGSADDLAVKGLEVELDRSSQACVQEPESRVEAVPGHEQYVKDLAAKLALGDVDLRGNVGQRFTTFLSQVENASAAAEYASFNGQPGCRQAKKNFRMKWAKEQHDGRVVIR